jgi:hypothetical protein
MTSFDNGPEIAMPISSIIDLADHFDESTSRRFAV